MAKPSEFVAAPWGIKVLFYSTSEVNGAWASKVYNNVLFFSILGSVVIEERKPGFGVCSPR